MKKLYVIKQTCLIDALDMCHGPVLVLPTFVFSRNHDHGSSSHEMHDNGCLIAKGVGTEHSRANCLKT